MKNLLILICLIFISACKDKSRLEDKSLEISKVDNSCIKFNEEGVKKLNLFLTSGGKDSLSLIDAEKKLRLAVECDGNFLVARNNLFSVYNLMGNYQKALEFVIEQSKIEPENIQWKIQKARLYREIGNIDSAKSQYIAANKAYEKLMLKFPDSLDINLEILILKAYFDEPINYSEHVKDLKEKFPEESDKIDQYTNIIESILER